jgi:hypothetical protein
MAKIGKGTEPISPFDRWNSDTQGTAPGDKAALDHRQNGAQLIWRKNVMLFHRVERSLPIARINVQTLASEY